VPTREHSAFHDGMIKYTTMNSCLHVARSYNTISWASGLVTIKLSMSLYIWYIKICKCNNEVYFRAHACERKSINVVAMSCRFLI
jgi:hypothetical protein